MNETAKEYGTAIFMLACEENEKKSYADALEMIKSVFLAEPQYVELLSSPGIPLKERLRVIEDAFSGTVPENVLSYVELMCEKGRIQCFAESVDAYRELFNASEHVLVAKITSAVTLTEEEKQKLINKLESMEKGRVNAEYFVDASLLGGIIVEVDGRIIDGSLRHRLQEVKEVMNT